MQASSRRRMASAEHARSSPGDGDELDPVPPRDRGRGTGRARDLRGIGPRDLDPARGESCSERLERLDGSHAEARGAPWSRDGSRPQRRRAARAHRRGTTRRRAPREAAASELLEPEQLAVEPPRVVLAARRSSDLDVVEPDDDVAHRPRRCSAPRVTPGRKSEPASPGGCPAGLRQRRRPDPSSLRVIVGSR